MSFSDIELISLSKNYGANKIVREIDLDIPQGEFVSILGPSGCGKTTTLNMIAGFIAPTSGEIRVRGKNQSNVPPERRQIGLVFQNYALFPHMTVGENVAFGLKMARMGRSEIEAQVAKSLRSVHLEHLIDRYPKELSGGQQQRTALARAIAPRPSLLLLDEPLSNLDLKLREAMRIELKEVQQELGITFVYVTHDQEEAMAMSDRIVVMHEGVIAQVGSPGEIYRTPETSFVADFIGKSNIFEIAGISDDLGHQTIALDGGLNLKVDRQAKAMDRARYCCIRPEALRWSGERVTDDGATNVLDVKITKIVNLGAYLEVWGAHRSQTIFKALISAGRATHLSIDEPIQLTVDPSAIQLLAA